MAKQRNHRPVPPSFDLTEDQLRTRIRDHYLALHAQWAVCIQGDDTLWRDLFDLHYRILDLERRAPWLRKELQ